MNELIFSLLQIDVVKSYMLFGCKDNHTCHMIFFVILFCLDLRGNLNKQSTLQYIHSDDCLGFHLCLDGVSFTRLISCETNIFHLGKCIWRWETPFPDHYKPFPGHYTPFPTMKLLDLPYPYKLLHYYEDSWPTMLVYRTHDLILPNLFLLFRETFKSFCGHKKSIFIFFTLWKQERF